MTILLLNITNHTETTVIMSYKKYIHKSTFDPEQIPFCVLISSPLLCCSPLDTVTHSFHAELWRTPPAATQARLKQFDL